MVSQNKSAKYWYQENLPMAKDCARCSDLDICGGLRVLAPIDSCLELCSGHAAGKMSNGSVCKCDSAYFVQRKREVGGWRLNVARAPNVSHSVLPLFVPMVYDRARRSVPYLCDTVAVPLSKLMSTRSGNLLADTHEALCERFLVGSGAKIVVTGVHHDPTLENYWSKARSRDIAQQLRRLNPELVTTPNFSVFADVQRWDNFHNMKRIAICWYELTAAGNPAALHINARTPRDYQRWSEFLNEHDEIDTIAFEFQTGTASTVRSKDHIRWLQILADQVQRPLTLVSFGGWPHLNALVRSFNSVTHISATPFMRASHYKKLVSLNSKRATLRLAPTDMSADDLLHHNINVYSMVLSKVASDAA